MSGSVVPRVPGYFFAFCGAGKKYFIACNAGVPFSNLRVCPRRSNLFSLIFGSKALNYIFHIIFYYRFPYH